MDYLLFLKGVFEPSDVEAVWGDRRLLIKRAAPDTLFALFGAVLIGICLWKGTDFATGAQFRDSSTKPVENVEAER